MSEVKPEMSELDREVQRRLVETGAAIREAAKAAVGECAAAMADQARADCPVETGRLRDSIRVEVDADAGAGVIAARICADAPYAAAVELGTGGRAPQPFLFPALEKQGPGLPAILRERLAEM